MHHTDLDLIVARLMYPILVDKAPSGKTIQYKEIAEQIKSENPDVIEIRKITQRHIGRKLGTIWEFTKLQGCPHIGSLVVSQNGECGSGISGIIHDLPRERERVQAFDWATVTPEFDAYIEKAKHIKTEQERKRVKRSEQEARECLFKYWEKVKEDEGFPLSKDDLLKIKGNILTLLENGTSPEEALSLELIKFLGQKNRPSPKNGFVYIGEYVDSETKAPIFNQFKIGFTGNLEDRALAIAGGVVGPLEFIIRFHWKFKAGEAYAVEQAMHGKFSQHRKKGEFFDSIGGLLPELVDDEITSKFGELLQATDSDSAE